MATTNRSCETTVSGQSTTPASETSTFNKQEGPGSVDLPRDVQKGITEEESGQRNTDQPSDDDRSASNIEENVDLQYLAEAFTSDEKCSKNIVIEVNKKPPIHRDTVLPDSFIHTSYSPASDIDESLERLMKEPLGVSKESQQTNEEEEKKEEPISVTDSLPFASPHVQIPRQRPERPTMKFDFRLVQDLVKTGAISVVTCAATLSGLSQEKKEYFFQEFMKVTMNFKNSNAEIVRSYYERSSKETLSNFNFNILGSYPFDDLMWLLATKRSSFTLSFLSCLVQVLRIRDIPFSNLRLPQQSDATSATNDQEKTTLGKQHMNWLFNEALTRMKALQSQPEKLRMLGTGITLLNIINVGSTKSAYEFAPFLMQYCKRSLPLLFITSEDTQRLDQAISPSEHVTNLWRNPYMTVMKHLRHFSRRDSCAEDPDVLFLGTPESSDNPLTSLDSKGGFLERLKQRLSDKGLHVTPHSINVLCMAETKKNVEKMVTRNMSKFVTNLPLRWVFLHSLLNTFKISLMRRADINQLAISCDIGMNNTEVELFLETFTSFGSLLYIPSLTDVVIVNIEQFTDCLDKLYSYSEKDRSSKASSFGFISEAAINSLVEDMKLDVIMFKDIVRRFHFALPISQSQVALPHSTDFTIDPRSYYVPSMRTSQATNGPQFGSLYLHFNPEYIPGNMQVWLLRHFLKLNNCFLHPYSHINASLIDIRCSTGHEVQVKIIYHGDFTELRLENHTNQSSQQDISEVCSLVVKVCKDAIEDVKKSLDGTCEYKFVLRGSPDNPSHFISSTVADQLSCDESGNDQVKNLRMCWIRTVKEAV